MLLDGAALLLIEFGLIILLELNSTLDVGLSVLVTRSVDSNGGVLGILLLLLPIDELPWHALEITSVHLAWRYLQHVVVLGS